MGYPAFVSVVSKTLLGGADVRSFLDAGWDRRVRVIRGGAKAMPWAVSVDELLAFAEKHGNWTSRLEVVADRYRQGISFEGGPREAIRFGCSVQIFCVERKDAAIAEWARSVLDELNVEGESLEGHYGRHGEGIDWHSDRCAFFSIQVHGRKTWLLAPARTSPLPEGNTMIDEPEECTRELLEPLDVIYIPSHFAHRTEAAEESLSLTIPFELRT